MNYVLLSPHFPPNYRPFATRLRELGVTTLGIADEAYDRLAGELRDSLVEYYRVPDMHDYDSLLRGLGHFTHRHGKIDGLDSQNEYWLETEARLRDDFNIPGLRSADMPPIKRKSEMKKVFASAGVASGPGRLLKSPQDARLFASEHGFPLIAKPDTGVGAHKTYRLDNQDELQSFLSDFPTTEYFLEKFISGVMQTFDGIVDRSGQVVFCSSMQYSRGIMETVNEDGEIYYYTLRRIPPAIESAGRTLVAAYGLRRRFFHFEFFVLPDGRALALEVNMRPPGGLTTDMFNYSNDIDVYREWANIVTGRPFSAEVTRPYHCAYVGRKNNREYLHSHESLVSMLGNKLVHHEPIAGVFSAALGNHGYLVRSRDIDDIHAMAAAIHARRSRQ